MDRTIVLRVSAPIPQGHRVEVAEDIDETSGAERTREVVDLDTGVRYVVAGLSADSPGGRGVEILRWAGRVLTCTVYLTEGGPSTSLLIDPVDSTDVAGGGATAANVALRGADAAADAAKAQADRWGGADRPPPEEPERFW